MTLEEYIIDVVYRSVYYTNKLSCQLKTGGVDSRRAAYLLSLATMYIDYLNFYTSNDSAFEADEVKKVAEHLDIIFKSNYSLVENSYDISIPTGSGVVKRFYGLTTDPSPEVDDDFLDTLTADTVYTYQDPFEFTISGPPNQYCIIAIPYTGTNYQYEQWTDTNLNGYYFRRIKSVYGYTYNGTLYTLDVYISYWNYAADRTFQLL